MGWYSLIKPKEITVEQFFQSESFFGSKSTILKSALINMREFYAAVSTENEVWAFVALIDFSKPKGTDRTNFAYKDMDENCLPYYFNCPEKILNLLSPTDNENALKWRDSCRRQIAKKKELVPGVLIKFERAIPFTNGDELQIFELIKNKKNGMCFKKPNSNTFYCITGWQRRKYEVISPIKTSTGCFEQPQRQIPLF